MSRPLEALLGAWLPGQRWYAAKGRSVGVRVVADIPLPVRRDDGTRACILVVDLLAGGSDTLQVQVPVVMRHSPADLPPGAHIGTIESADGTLHIYDGPHDPVYVTALTDVLSGAARHAGTSGWVASTPGPLAIVRGDRAPAGRILSGEQSNTSIIVEPPGGPAIIIKVFRSLQDGDNPDIVLQSALAAAGSTRVATPAGALRGGWVGSDGQQHTADLAFASQYLPDAPDAWRTATAAVSAGLSFDADARDLGAATAEVHQALAASLPTAHATPQRLARLAESLAARAAWAVDATGGHIDSRMAAAAAESLARVSGLTAAPSWQRIHGDLHLGQVLRPAGRGWVLLDFEGEPLRSLPERQALDTPLRDVAGMLRSFDYAAAFAGDAGPAATAWVDAACSAFCEGYAAVTGEDPRVHEVLLRALELDKALYELVYETRNRPDWIRVPLGAVQRLLGAATP